MRRQFVRFVFLVLMVAASLHAQEERLQLADIHKIMEQIFARHVAKKAMSEEILKHAFGIYIEQFDPQGLYLLQDEVEPYLNMESQKLAQIQAEYKEGNYEAFEKLNRLFQTAIVRARAIRASLEKDPSVILQGPSMARASTSSPKYPASQGELKERISSELKNFLEHEMKRYGGKAVTGNEVQALQSYELRIKESESAYLFQQPDGKPLSAEEQENLFALHVLKALARSLDAHTEVFDQNEAYDMRVRLEKGFDGVGIVFNDSTQGIAVSSLIENGPAEKQGGIKAGDLLVEVNGVSVKGLPFEKVMELLKGEKGEGVTLGFLRKGAPYKVTLQREVIVLSKDRVEVSQEQFGNGIIGRIVLHSFYQNDKGINSEEDVRQAIHKLDEQGNLRGLILDLRDNSGGFLSQAVKVAGLFITNGVIVISKYADGNEKIYRDMDSKVAYSGPLVVLTSKATASAAEIVAQALQDYGVALVVGDEQTYGKGTIQSQTVTEGKGSSLFKVTVGEYYTVSGKTPQIQGVKADVVVPGPYSRMQFGEENLEFTLKGNDKIDPAYRDKLQDIDPNLRSWYLKYYMPTLQHRTNLWRSLIPQLQKNSSYRLSKDKNYQLFLKKLSGESTESGQEDDIAEAGSAKNKGFGETDPQLIEAYNVVKDMVYLQAKVREQEMMVGSEKN